MPPIGIRDEMLAIAVELADEGGSAALTTRALAERTAERLGRPVSGVAPLVHFGDRVGLLAAVGAEGFRDLLERFERAARGATSCHPGLSLALAYIRFALQRPHLYRVMHAEGTWAARAAGASTPRRIEKREHWLRALEEVRDACFRRVAHAVGDALLARAVTAMCDGYVRQVLDEQVDAAAPLERHLAYAESMLRLLPVIDEG